MRFRTAFLISLGAAALVLTPVIAVGAQGDDETIPAHIAGSTLTDAVQTVPSTLQRSISILRGDEVSSSRRVTAAGLNRDLAAVVETEIGPITIEPGAQLTCLWLMDAKVGKAGGCAPNESAAAGKLTVSLLKSPHGPGMIAGLVPDNVSSVVIEKADGTSTTAHVLTNVWVAQDVAAKTIELRDPDGIAIGSIDLHR